MELQNKTTQEENVEVKFEVLDANGKVVFKKALIATVKEFSMLKEELMVKNPKLWDIDTTNLYHLQTTVVCKGEILHQEKTHFGFREIRWETETGFWLNGRNVKLQGVCNHHDTDAASGRQSFGR